jgi:hypothetical protein
MRVWRLVVLSAAGLTIAGCSSPEAVRQRGGGRGADPNNRPPGLVVLHEGSRQFWKTPVRIGVQHVPLDSSEQARRVSLSPPRDGGSR